VIIDDDSFRQFAGALEKVIDGYGASDNTEASLLVKQCGQFQRLIDMETDFRETLIRCRSGPKIYQEFITKICDTNGNILTLRPYFRERQEVCIGPIAQAFKKRHVQSLYQYRFNFNFVSFVMDVRQWSRRNRLSVLSQEISKLRREIVELNMPLAISQARIFWQKAPAKTQDSRFTFMDFVQTSADGLMSAVDKFVPPAEAATNPAAIRVWRAVAIGRMKGNFIEMFSETSIHFFPQHKRIIYRANKHLKDFPNGIDWEKLKDLVNADLASDGLVTTAIELQALMGAAQNIGDGATGAESSSDAGGDLRAATPLERAEADAEWQPDTRFEKAQIHHVLLQSVHKLEPLERKFMRMRGLQLDPI
jgi:hypothetical protein